TVVMVSSEQKAMISEENERSRVSILILASARSLSTFGFACGVPLLPLLAVGSMDDAPSQAHTGETGDECDDENEKEDGEQATPIGLDVLDGQSIGVLHVQAGHFHVDLCDEVACETLWVVGVGEEGVDDLAGRGREEGGGLDDALESVDDGGG
ncbi:9383_t:CDS:2, partial [Acaulospora colombiana]